MRSAGGGGLINHYIPTVGVIVDLLYGAKVVPVATNGPLMDPLEVLHSTLEILHRGYERGL